MALILIIEDNAANLELMRYLLTAAGHDCRCAVGGPEGLAEALQRLPDLVVCDIQLPGMHGADVLQRLNLIPGFVGRPVIAVTALAMLGDRERILAQGFNGYLSKPIIPQGFAGQIAGFLEGHR
jgi:two-component system cell cycle response regulator